MATSYLIDGYNLLYALGMMPREVGSAGLEFVRRRFLDVLVPLFGKHTADVTIVFDARRKPGHLLPEQNHHGMRLIFAPPGDSADDVIERMIDDDESPRFLVVISNDHRIQQAAKRGGATSWSCAELLEKAPKSADNDAGKREEEERSAPTDEEVRSWTREFADMENDPEFKAWFQQDRFDEKEGDWE
jgi:predicted RNA-binding protein with PIN domain